MNTANKNKVLRSYIISFLICYINIYFDRKFVQNSPMAI